MIGQVQANGFLRVEGEEPSTLSNRSIYYRCICVRLIAGSECGRKRRVRADHWRNGRETMCRHCVEEVKKDRRQDSLWDGVPLELLPRLRVALVLHLQKAKACKTDLSISRVYLKRFVAEIVKSPFLLEDYTEIPRYHVEDVQIMQFPQYVPPVETQDEF